MGNCINKTRKNLNGIYSKNFSKNLDEEKKVVESTCKKKNAVVS